MPDIDESTQALDASAPHHRASGVGQALAAVIGALDEDTVREIHRIIGHTLAAPSNQELREGRLGLLLELVVDGTGELITQPAYEQARAERAVAGEAWTSAVAITNAYGGWNEAVKAAMRLNAGRSHGVSSGKTAVNGQRTRAYSRPEGIAAIRKCARWLEGSPRAEEYVDWRALEIRAARLNGKPIPRLPSMKRIRNLFGSFERAADLAERQG